ncbi:hypothetical protein D9M73_110230 [compost metagenome]
MHDRDHRGLLGGVGPKRREQPTLDGEAIIFPSDAARGHRGGDRIIVMRDLHRCRDRPGEDRGGMGEVLRDGGDGQPVRAEGGLGIARREAGRAAPAETVGAFAGKGEQPHPITAERGAADEPILPHQRRHRQRAVRHPVLRFAPGERHGPHIAADRAEIAHQPANIGDRLAVGGNAGEIELRRRLGDRADRARLRIHRIERRHPPIVIAIAQRRGDHEPLAVRRPVIFVNITIRR